MKHLRNTSAVLVLTLFTALAVFTAIQLGGRVFGTPTASAQTISTRAAQSQPGTGGAGGQSSNGTTQSDPYGYGSSGGSSSAGSSSGSGSSSGGQTYTCPATGCTASTCHATQ